MSEEFEVLGEVLVDSGQIGVIDPCHIDKTTPPDAGTAKSGPLVLDNGVAVGVASDTGVGDGRFPVVACLEDGKIVGLFIDLAI